MLRTNGVVAILILCLVACTGALAQVAPEPGAPWDSSSGSPAHRGPTPEIERQPAVGIIGWSFKGEIRDKSLQHGSRLILDPGHPEVVLFFAGELWPSQPVEFRYRLSDYDPDWTITANQTAHYRRLPPGSYQFQVQARLLGQPWGSRMAVLSLTQQPFFYQTWFAYVIVGLGVLAIAWQILHQRDQLLKGQIGIVLEERNRIASDCHDTLMASFAAVSWQLEAAYRLFGEPDKRHLAIEACELARSMVSHCQVEARRIIWDLRSPEGITDLLSQGLGLAIAAHRLSGTVPIQLTVEGDEVPISPGAVHHLVCISQEAISNSLRHAEPSRVDVQLRFERELLQLSIRDDGTGFPTSSGTLRTGHFGIPVMQERARKLGAVLRLTSSGSTGTEVSVSVDFQHLYTSIGHQEHLLPWIGV